MVGATAVCTHNHDASSCS